MKKISSIIIILIIYTLNIALTQVPEIEWQKIIGLDGADELYSIQQTTDGGYILGGTHDTGLCEVYLVAKLNATGQTIEWQKPLGGSRWDNLRSARQTTDGGYILGGYSDSPGHAPSDRSLPIYGSKDYWIVKLDVNGNVVWDKSIGGDDNDYLYSLELTTDGGYILGGISWSGISGLKTEASQGGYDYWVVKCDGAGNIVWQNTIGGSEWDELHSLHQTTDGGYILGGHSKSGISGDKTDENIDEYDWWVLKLDVTGQTIEWQKTFGGLKDDELYSVRQTTDGGYILGGFTIIRIEDGGVHDDYIGDYRVIKLNGAGNVVWDKTFGGYDDDKLYSVRQTADGGYILGGYSDSEISGDKTEESRGSADFWLVKLDGIGNIVGQNTIGGDKSDVLYSLDLTSDGEYILGGHSTSNISGDKTVDNVDIYGAADYWVVRLESISTAPEMELKQDVTAIEDDGSYNYGSRTTNTNTDIIFTIENSGTADLTITIPLTISGADADQFSIQAQPTSSVAHSGGTTTFTVRFTPTSVGVKSASISIENSDCDENPYDLTLNGTGTETPPILESWIQIGSDIDGEAAIDYSGCSVSLSSNGKRVAIGAYRNDGNGSDAGYARIFSESEGVWTQVGGSIVGEAAGDNSGDPVSLSADGKRVAIGASSNDGTDWSAGHVRVFSESGSVWTQLGSDIDGEAGSDRSGSSVALSADGKRVAIGAQGNDGSGSYAGHVRVYSEFEGVWTQIGSDIDGEAEFDYSGWSVSLSSNGCRVAIGATGNDGTGDFAGHVRVYSEFEGVWTQVGNDIDGEAAGDGSGSSVSLSANGKRVAIGAPYNGGTGTTAGHVRVYSESEDIWTQMGNDIDGEAAGDGSGSSVSLSSNGCRVAIGATGNEGTGVLAGHVRVYSESGGEWTQVGSDIDGEAAEDGSGRSVSLSSDGSRVAIGAPYNDGVDSNAGHARIYIDDTFTAPEMELKQNATSIADGGNYDYGNQASFSNTDVIFTIENNGDAELTLTLDLAVTGTNADQFSIQAQPTSSVAHSGGTTTFTVRFTPTSVGSKTASILIENSDCDENPYDLLIYGSSVSQCIRGSIIYNTDTNKFNFCEDGVWIEK